MHCLSRTNGNPRLGRFFAVDPLAREYPHNSPYAFSENRLLDGVELEGLEWREMRAVARAGLNTAKSNSGGAASGGSAPTTSVPVPTKPAGVTGVASQAFDLAAKAANSTNSSPKSAGQSQPVSSMIPTPMDMLSASISVGINELEKKIPEKGHFVFSYASSRNFSERFYYKPDGRGLNNLKGGSITAQTGKTLLKTAGVAVGFAFELPEIIDGYNTSAEEGNKQVAGAVGNVGGGILVGMGAGAALFGSVGAVTGPFDFIFIACGVAVGGAIGEAGVEALYESFSAPFVPRSYTNEQMNNLTFCFIGGTLVSMYDGSLKMIENVVIGDSIKSYNEKNGLIENSTVLEISKNLSNQKIEITFSNGVQNINTLGHPYFVKNKGWCSVDTSITKNLYQMSVKRLEIGDTCFYLHNEIMQEVMVVDFVENNNSTWVYNLTHVEKNNNFFCEWDFSSQQICRPTFKY